VSDPELVHVYQQSVPHDGVYIVGNRPGLLRLRAAIEAALSQGDKEVLAFINDGSAYMIKVIALNEHWKGENWPRISVPYTDSTAMEGRENAIWPWQIRKDA
jgi:hypothetical protein